jgi:hypothetical protein
VSAHNAREVIAIDAVLGPSFATSSAGLGSSRRGDSHKLATGALSLVREESDELAPACVEDRAVESGLGGNVLARLRGRACSGSCHRGNVQVFDDDQIEVLDEPCRDLVSAVQTLIPHSFVLTAEALSSTNAPAAVTVTGLVATCERPLKPG